MGSGIPVWSDLTISDGLKYMSGSYKIAMVYTGDSAPMLVLENKYSYSWIFALVQTRCRQELHSTHTVTLHKLSATTV